MPLVLRGLALLALFAVVLGIGIAFYRGGEKTFVMHGMPTQLSKDVVAEIVGYERREMEGDKIKFYIKDLKSKNDFIQILRPFQIYY